MSIGGEHRALLRVGLVDPQPPGERDDPAGGAGYAGTATPVARGEAAVDSNNRPSPVRSGVSTSKAGWPSYTRSRTSASASARYVPDTSHLPPLDLRSDAGTGGRTSRQRDRRGAVGGVERLLLGVAVGFAPELPRRERA